MIFFIFSVHFSYLCWDTLPGSLGMSIAADFPDALPPPAGLVPLVRELEGNKLMVKNIRDSVLRRSEP